MQATIRRMMERKTKAVALVLVLATLLAAILSIYTNPASAQQASAQQYPETVPVTFQLTIDGDVPEGRLLGVDFPLIADVAYPVFCSTAAFDSETPRCEDGATYTDTFEEEPPRRPTLSVRYLTVSRAATKLYTR